MDAVPFVVAAHTDDAAAIAAIYAHHVRHGTASFETIPPDAGAIAHRMAKVAAAGGPWLIARGTDGASLGYAYAGPFGTRAGYRFTCEDSIYVAHDRRGQGIGTALLAALLTAGETAGWRQMIAVIAGTEPASVALHRRFGFVHAGLIRAVGRKQGGWIDIIHMQRALGAGDAAPPPFEPE